MAGIVDEVLNLFELYPPWLVGACLIIVTTGLVYALWKLVKIGMVVLVTALLIGLVVFAGWMILSP